MKSIIIAWGVEIGSLITEMTWKSSTKENDFGGCLNDNRFFGQVPDIYRLRISVRLAHGMDTRVHLEWGGLSIVSPVSCSE